MINGKWTFFIVYPTVLLINITFFPYVHKPFSTILDAYLDVLLRWYTDVTTIMATRTREARLGKLAGILGVALFA